MNAILQIFVLSVVSIRLVSKLLDRYCRIILRYFRSLLPPEKYEDTKPFSNDEEQRS